MSGLFIGMLKIINLHFPKEKTPVKLLNSDRIKYKTKSEQSQKLKIKIRKW